MLVLSRHSGQRILIGDDIVIEVRRLTPHDVDLAITAHPSLKRLLLPDHTDVPADQEVISRGRNESLQLGADIQIAVVDIRGDKVRLGIDCPGDFSVHRED